MLALQPTHCWASLQASAPCGLTIRTRSCCKQVACSDALPAGSERSLEGFTLKRLAHFLRFTYHPDEVRGDLRCMLGWPAAARLEQSGMGCLPC